MEGVRSTEADVPSLSCYPPNYSNISIQHVIFHLKIERYYIVCNEIYKHNRMRQSDLAVDKYWVTYSGYFRLVTTVTLVIGITYGNFLFCHGISEQSNNKTIPMKEYNNRTVYDCFNNPFLVYGGSPALNLSTLTIGDSPCPKTISQYTSDPLPDAIYVTSGNYDSTLTILSEFPQFPVFNYYNPDTEHTIMSDNPLRVREKRGYGSRFHDGKIRYKKPRLYCYVCSINKRVYCLHGPIIMG